MMWKATLAMVCDGERALFCIQMPYLMHCSMSYDTHACECYTRVCSSCAVRRAHSLVEEKQSIHHHPNDRGRPSDLERLLPTARNYTIP